MISYIRGELVSLEEEKAIVDVNGVGYGVFITGRTANGLNVDGREVKLHTYLNVKEDAMQLYGFFEKEELQIFKLLLGVNGIGPKGAMGILSHLTPDEIRFAVFSRDAKTIAGAPGIGKKTAEKLILELKDKLKIEDTIRTEDEGGNTPVNTDMGIQTDAIMALVALGYGNTEAMRAVKKVPIGESTSVESLLKDALKFLM